MSEERNQSSERASRVRAQFGPVAADYGTSEVHAAGESLSVLLRAIQPSGGSLLDVATGAGHTALAFAPSVDRVTATDITNEMLEETRRLAADRGVNNLETRMASAEQLPFEDESFDYATCRLAAHHFDDYAGAIGEMARVVRSGGLIGFTDNVTVEDEPAVAYYNRFELLRDPSHNRVLSEDALRFLFEAPPPAGAGLEITLYRRLSKEFEFHSWADRQRVSKEDKARLQEMMREAPPALEPLFRPRWEDGTMYFHLWEAVIVARRRS